MENIDKRRKSYLIIIAVLFILLVILFLYDLIIVKRRSHEGRAIASVNGFVVYEGDLTDRINSLTSNGQSITIEQLPENVLKAMVLEVVVNNQIDQDAKKLKYQKDPEIKKLVDNYRNGLIREKYLNDNIYSKVTDEEVEKEYDRLVRNLEGKEERRIKHILVEDEDEIERVRRNVLRTGNFERIARQKSIDTVSGENGGDIGYVLKEELVPEFGDMAFILKIGEISKPVKTQYGWHIIKVEDARPAQFLPFEEVKENIRQRLQQQAIQDYLVSLTKDADVEFKIDLQAPNNLNSEENKNVEEIVIEQEDSKN